jgi:AraC family transcriptional regulator
LVKNRKTADSAGESFLGAPWRSASAGGFAIGLWYAETFGDDVEEHEHEHAHLMIVLSGRYHSRAPGADRDPRPVVFNPPGTCHRDRFLTSGSFMSIAVSAAQWAEIADDRASAEPVCVGHGARGLVATLMRHVAGSIGVEESLLSENLCVELLGLAARGMAERERRRPQWLDRAIEMLICDLSRDVSLADVARAAGVHPVHMTRGFRAFERCTPSEYVAAARLRRAAELLSEARLPLAEVALTAGFADQSHFSRRFRGGYGVTPGEYRRRTARRRIVTASVVR